MNDTEKKLIAIRYTADRTKRNNEHGFTLLKLGIRGAIYFNTRDDVADALTALMDFYYEWAKDKLTIARHERGHRDIKKVKLTEKSYLKERDTIYRWLDNRKENPPEVMWGMQSEHADTSASYYFDITSIAAGLVNEAHMPLGTLLFNLPLEILSSPKDLAKLDEFVDKIAEKLDVFHGYIGLAAIPPHNYYDGAPYEYGVCRENFGLIPVTTDYLSTFYRYNIRSISWYTLVGRELYGQLPAGRIEPVLANHPDIQMRDIAGIKVFKIGNLPETGDIHEDLPLDYIALNRALEPIREKYPRENMGGITREQMYYWSRRWDGWEVEEKDGKKIYTQAPQEIIGVEEEPVPISGIWKITSFNGETRHFNKGEIFPEGEGERTQKALLGPQMGLTIWELVKGDHDESLRRKPIW
ncbi:TPA: type VI immunity family protein [Neisseria subflava]